jgi:hypothetical protein
LIRQLAIVTSKQNDQKAGTPGNGLAVEGKADAGVTVSRPNSASGGAKAPQALDRWFDDQLNQLFNDVSSEPLPPDLAKLIGELKAQGQK